MARDFLSNKVPANLRWTAAETAMFDIPSHLLEVQNHRACHLGLVLHNFVNYLSTYGKEFASLK